MSMLKQLARVALLAWCGVALAGEDAEGRRAVIELRQRVDALTSAVNVFHKTKRDADQINDEIVAWKRQLELGSASTDDTKQSSIKTKIDGLTKQVSALAIQSAPKKLTTDATKPSDSLSTGDAEARKSIVDERERVEYWEREWKLPVKNWEAMGWGSLFRQNDDDLRLAIAGERQRLDRLTETERADPSRLKLFVEQLQIRLQQFDSALQTATEQSKQRRQREIVHQQSVELQRVAWEKEVKAALPRIAHSPRKLVVCSSEGLSKSNCFGGIVGSNGGEYLGEWLFNQYDGLGIYKASNGDRYVGQFKANQINGEGIYYYANGERYSGEIRKNDRHGKGVLYAANGSVIEDGIWVAGIAPSAKYAEDARAAAQIWKNKIQSEIAVLRQKSAERMAWTELVSTAVLNTLHGWLEDTGSLNIQEIPSPVFPLALSVTQEKWESDKEFEERLTAARAERQREIEKIQNTYKTQVDQRNTNLQLVNAARLAKERIAPLVRKEFTEIALGLVEPQFLLAGSSFDPKRAILYLDVKIDGAAPIRFEFADAPLPLRKAALTAMSDVQFTAEVGVSTSGEFGLKNVKVMGVGTSAMGLVSQGTVSPQSVRQVMIDLPSATATGVLTQQSVRAVDGNQVERILYREENEALRKRLEKQ